MNTILSWLKSKNITSHSIVVAIIFMAGIVVEDQSVRNFVLQLFQTHPKLGTMLLTLAGIVFKYSRSSTPTSVLEQASVIKKESSNGLVK